MSTFNRNKLFVLLLILLAPQISYANIFPDGNPPSRIGGIFIPGDNSLRVVSETISYDISNPDLSAQVNVLYTVTNEGKEIFDRQMFFISEVGRGNENVSDAVVKINGRNTAFKKVEDVIVDELTKGSNTLRTFDGYMFDVWIQPGETVKIEVKYTQAAGNSMKQGGLTFASLSHYMNLFGDASRWAYTYKYHVFPIKSFGRGVDEIIIRIRYPRKSAQGRKFDDLRVNVPLRTVFCSREYCEVEGRFRGVPADTIDIALNFSGGNRYGFTITPLYSNSRGSDDMGWGGSFSLDYIGRRSRVSAGMLTNFNERFLLFQDIRFFPDGYGFFLGECLDYRFGLGLAEQIDPGKNFGFRVIAGLRILIAFECVYQVFPPWITGKWEQELQVSVPFSF